MNHTTLLYAAHVTLKMHAIFQEDHTLSEESPREAHTFRVPRNVPATPSKRCISNVCVVSTSLAALTGNPPSWTACNHFQLCECGSDDVHRSGHQSGKSSDPQECVIPALLPSFRTCLPPCVFCTKDSSLNPIKISPSRPEMPAECRCARRPSDKSPRT